MSSLLEADSSVALSITLELTTTSQIFKKGKKSSPVWAYTRMPLENENLDLFYCSYCEQGLIAKRAPYGSKKSSAIIKYINRYHPLIIIKKTTNKKQEIVN
jgi:hypothetical protein